MNKLVIPKFNSVKPTKVKMQFVTAKVKGENKVFQLFTPETFKSRKKVL